MEEVAGGRHLLYAEGGLVGFSLMLPQVSVAESPPSLLTPRSLEIHFVKLSSLHYTLGPSTSIRHVSDSITFFSFGGALILRIKNIF